MPVVDLLQGGQPRPSTHRPSASDPPSGWLRGWEGMLWGPRGSQPAANIGDVYLGGHGFLTSLWGWSQNRQGGAHKYTLTSPVDRASGTEQGQHPPLRPTGQRLAISGDLCDRVLEDTLLVPGRSAVGGRREVCGGWSPRGVLRASRARPNALPWGLGLGSPPGLHLSAPSTDSTRPGPGQPLGVTVAAWDVVDIAGWGKDS